MVGIIVAGFYSLLWGKFTKIFCFCFNSRVHYHSVFYGSLIDVAWMFLGKSVFSIYIFCALYQIVIVGLLHIGATLSLQMLKSEDQWASLTETEILEVIRIHGGLCLNPPTTQVEEGLTAGL